MADYKEKLVKRYWNYQTTNFPEVGVYFDRPHAPDGRPPVFCRHQAGKNVITNPGASQEEIRLLLRFIPMGERHKWFRSMNSSQALAQSVFGNLAIYGYLSHLADLVDESGLPLFGDAKISPENFYMEYKINYLGEPRPTSLDCFISGRHQVAIECKFTESEVGSCSRPRLTPSASNYETDFCNGTYSNQRGRKEKCSLTEIGVLYWKFIPVLFNWQSTKDIFPCPVNKNYQLVRNVLAACVNSVGNISDEKGHVIVIYDERNPAFQSGSKGLISYEETRNALKKPTILRKYSWQSIIKFLRNNYILPWLTEQLNNKYGF